MLENLTRWINYYPILNKIYDFDYSSVLEVEKYQLQRLCNYIEKYGIHLNKQCDINHIKTMIKILDLILTDDWWDIKDKKYILPYTNLKNGNRFVKYFDELDNSSGIWSVQVRQEKLWNLYNKMHQQYLRNFWD